MSIREWKFLFGFKVGEHHKRRNIRSYLEDYD